MKIKITGKGGHRIFDNMLIFNIEDQSKIEINAVDAKEIALTLLDSLNCTNQEMCDFENMIDNKLIERGDI